jgi:hypothetical protein
MNDRKPICLYLAAAYPALLCGYFLFCAIFINNTYPHGGNEGGLPANFGTGLVVLAIMALLYVIGLTLVIASLLRGEKFRRGAWICLAIYLLPAAIPILFSFGFR